MKKIVGKSIIMLLSFATMLQVPAFAAVASDFGLYYNPKQTMTVIEFDYSSLYGGADGCAVIYDTNANVYNVYNRDAITKRIAPCSTCKIYSALNALEQGIISASENTVQWDYLSRDIPSWNGNQNLNSAMKNSVNWYFQYLDNSVGADELESFYKRIGYGNGFIGNDTMYYWNGSKLKISPLEQVDLLKKLYNNKLGANKDNVSAIKDAIFIAERNGYRLFRILPRNILICLGIICFGVLLLWLNTRKKIKMSDHRIFSLILKITSVFLLLLYCTEIWLLVKRCDTKVKTESYQNS